MLVSGKPKNHLTNLNVHTKSGPPLFSPEKAPFARFPPVFSLVSQHVLSYIANDKVKDRISPGEFHACLLTCRMTDPIMYGQIINRSPAIHRCVRDARGSSSAFRLTETDAEQSTARSSGMAKGIPVVLLFIVLALTAFAGENRIDPANIDKINTTRPIVIEKYEYYEIMGCCEKDLRCDIAKKGCRWDDGKIYDSVTSWSLKWDYGTEHTRPVCTPEAITVTLEIIFRYPKWVPTADAPQPLVNKWNAYLKGLIAHESGHRDMAVEAATEFSRALKELSPNQSCSELDRMVQTLSRERMDKLNMDSKAYDLATKHGAKQGVSFP